MPAVVKFTKAKKKQFIKVYIDIRFNVLATCKRIGISEGSFYHAMESDNDFNDEIKLANKGRKYLVQSKWFGGVNNPKTEKAYLDMLEKKTLERLLEFDEVEDTSDISFDITKEEFIEDEKVFEPEGTEED